MDTIMKKAKNGLLYIEKHKTKIAFTIILIIAIFTRFYKVTKIPYGIHVDEAGMAYDAYSLANYGTDRFLNKFPVYLINFGGGQSALYAYLASFFIKILGFNMLAIRLPAVLLGITAIVLSYLIAKKEVGENFAIVFMALITICPWHIMASRWGLDCNLLAPMLIISLYLLLRAKKIGGYIIAGISFGFTLYTYALSYLIVPIFLFLAIIYCLITKRIKFRHVLVMGVPIFILALPLMLMFLVNNDIIEPVRTFITIPELSKFRDSEIDFDNIEDNENFFDIMTTNDGLPYNAIPEFGSMYKFSIFLAVFGIFIEINDFAHNIKKRKFTVNALVLFMYISIMSVMLIISGPNINKANAVFIPLLFFTTTTLRMVYKNYKVFFGIMVCLYIGYFMEFQDYYFHEYSIEYKDQVLFEQDLLDTLNYVKNKQEFEEKYIYINTTSHQPYIYTLINDRISPQEFNQSRHYETGYNMSYGRYYFNSEEINENAVYIIKEKPYILNRLEVQRIYKRKL